MSVAFALDKSGPDDKALIALLNEIVGEMHADGTLSRLLDQVAREGRDRQAVLTDPGAVPNARSDVRRPGALLFTRPMEDE